MNKRWWLLGGVCVLALSIIATLPIQIPYAVTVPGKILCTNEWIVAFHRDGGIVTYVADRASGATKRYSLAQFNRGDAIAFSLSPHLSSGVGVAMGDTVGVVRSTEIERELQLLKGDLQRAEASLAATLAGEKQPIVEGARQEVERAKRQASELNAVLARQKLLLERGLVAQQEYDLAERRASTASIEVSIAEARLGAVASGAKREQADVVRSQIRSLRNQIDVLERQEESQRFVSPLSGVVSQFGTSDTLLVVSDTSAYVVVMPVPLHERSRLAQHQSVKIYASDVPNIPPAEIIAVDKTIHQLNGQQVVLATAQMSGVPAELLNGLLARCSIQCIARSPFDYAKRKLQVMLR